ncbi:MAG: right-handed parallel beta-helix repeat-containing protein [Streptomyces sp.]|nr:right-handed parallel beta-helix repeat-containing protein [Streptomyces sp.]
MAVAAGAGGVHLGLSNGGAQAATSTVTVSTTAQLESAVANAAAGTVIQVRAGTYHPAQGFVVTSSTGGIFRNLVTADNGDSGFTLRGDNTVNNLVQNLDSYGNYDRSGHGQNADGIAIKFGSGTGNKVTGARLYDNSDDGTDDAAWDNTLNGFAENSHTGAIVLNRNTAYVNAEAGFFFETGKARLARNLAVGNGGADKPGSRAVSAANSRDGGVRTPTFKSTYATTAYAARPKGGALPATVFLTTGSTTIGSTMD